MRPPLWVHAPLRWTRAHDTCGSTPRTARLTSRRGAEALEFALVLPIFLTLLAGTFDYGMLFFTQFRVNAELHTALRWGALQMPSELEREVGGCDACISEAALDAETALQSIGITMTSRALTPSLVQLDGTCALVLEAAIPHRPLVGLFTVPESYTVKSALPTQQVTQCD